MTISSNGSQEPAGEALETMAYRMVNEWFHEQPQRKIAELILDFHHAALQDLTEFKVVTLEAEVAGLKARLETEVGIYKKRIAQYRAKLRELQSFPSLVVGSIRCSEHGPQVPIPDCPH